MDSWLHIRKIGIEHNYLLGGSKRWFILKIKVLLFLNCKECILILPITCVYN